MFCYKGIVMQTRVFLLFILFLTLTVFYISATWVTVPMIISEQQIQTEILNQLDDRVFERVENDDRLSGN